MEKIIDMRETKEEKKISHPVLTTVMIWILIHVAMFMGYAVSEGIFSAVGVDTRYALVTSKLFGAIAAALLIKLLTGESVISRFKVKNFDVSIPVMLLVLTFSLGEVTDNICGHIMSSFMQIQENTTSDRPMLLAVLSSVVAAPLAEEIMYRYGILESAEKLGGKVFAIITSTLVFSAVHLYNMQGFIHVFISALLMAIIYYHTRNIWYVIIRHAINNALALIPLSKFSFCGVPVYHNVNGFVLSGTPWFIFNLVLMTVGFVWFFAVFYRKNVRAKADQG